MAWMNNPALRESTFQGLTGTGRMTLRGTIGKTFLLFAIMFVFASISWAMHSFALVVVGLIGTLILGFMIPFKSQWAPVTAPIYAVFEGVFVGSVSWWYATAMAGGKYAGAVPLAILGTFCVFAVMLFLYATRIIRVGNLFMTVVMGATAAIGLTYLATLLIGIFNKGIYSLPMYQASPIGIIFSCVVIVVATLNLAVDFREIEDGIASRAPRYMEWYGGFALLVTLVWLYLEILRLLLKLSRSR